MNISTDIDILLAKYFSGEASAKELSRLEDWLAESEEHQAYFDEMTFAYEKSAQAVPPRKADTAKALAMFEQYVQQATIAEQKVSIKSSSKRIAIRRYIQAAAVAVILAATATMFFFLQKGDDDKLIRIAATETAIRHTMPDSSIVVLSENSSISYEQDYGIKNKRMTLTGKASFDIDNKSDEKLIVSVGETFIKDIGTAFTVDGYADNQYIAVNVEHGIVLFYTAESSGLSLYEGEAGYYNNATKQFSKQVKGKTVDYNQIVFDATPLYKATERLSQQFNVAITLVGNSISNKQITVSFNQDEGIEHILHIIAETLRLKLQHENETFILSPL